MKTHHDSPPGHWNWRIPVTHRHGTRNGRLIFIGGQADLDARGNVCQSDLLSQVDASFRNLTTVLRGLGGRVADIVKINVFHTGATPEEEAALMQRIRARLPGNVPPVISLVAVPRLAYPGMAVTMDAVAIDNSDGGAPREGFTVDGVGGWPRDAQFSHGVRCGELMFVAAQSARDASGLIRDLEDIAAQARRTIDNIGKVLGAMAADLDDVVKLNTWYVGFGTDEDWRRAARIRSEAFTYPGPGATGVPVPARYPDGALIRQDCWAMRGVDGSRLPRTLSWPKGHWDWPIRVTFQQGVRVGDLIFLGGQYACDLAGRAQAPGDRQAQTRITMEFIRRILYEFGATLDDMVQSKCFYKSDGSPEALHANLAIRSGSFRDPAHATTSVPLSTMGLEGLMLEIEGIAMLQEGA